MIKVTLRDEVREFEAPVTFMDIAKSISEGLARTTLCAVSDGVTFGLYDSLDHDAAVEFKNFDSPEGKNILRHSASHVMAQAVKRLFPEARLAIGPAVENGFYYDFDLDKGFSPENLAAIEAEMKKIVKENYPIKRFELPREEAIKYMEEKGETYKVELINDLPEDSVISFYTQGEFTDLCAGPHVPSTGYVKAFKITSTAGAYWRGSEKNKMLTRIYATAFTKKQEMEEYLAAVEEAKTISSAASLSFSRQAR